MKIKQLTAASLLLAFSMPFAVSANDGPPPFAEIDKNGDGGLSLEEVAGSPLEEMFSQFDKNGDGLLSESEMPGPPQ